MATNTRKSSARQARPEFTCTECGWRTAKWVGRCGECQQWGTVVEAAASSGPRTTAVAPGKVVALPITEVEADATTAGPTGVSEFDRVLGGGLVAGAVVLLAGEPGIGKSTLLLDVAGHYGREDRTVLYVTAEESAAQVRMRAERIGAMNPGVLLVSETDLGAVLGHIEQASPGLLIVDSVQTIASSEVDGLAGGVSQVKEVASAIIAAAKARGLPVLLVGHVTKDGTLAGPRTLEHLVDVVCQFEGDRHTPLRLVRAVKNRYGATDEVGCFELTDGGISSLVDPSKLFLSRDAGTVAGTCVTVTLEGKRPLTTEIQALVTDAVASNPRRTTSGIDSPRVAMILAVLERHVRQGMNRSADVYVSTVGGARANEPACDLAIALALMSSARDRPLRRSLVAFGEVGLSGDLRPVAGLQRRLTEAYRLGFNRAIVPAGSADQVSVPMNVIEADTLAQAENLAIS
ncbi:DNA repair protein RadA [Rarobacter faecitabidus]|uniref:DNA repair protein RadA n=1 Tax=Rarobacter faecitabidus TaxID=13243 RepID=A0A542ZU94_RARFA|nr:DNA repair protein RadA [Rarobacter faecitabidus]TQL63770.1 DNA repair protein RadA/Sms [Rarobacter faecitabidus]